MGVLNKNGILQNGRFNSKNEFITGISGKKVNLVFLGDLSDRGVWGYEIYYTLFYLYLLNKDNKDAGKVFITRGNHEEIGINSVEGFLHNMQTLFQTKLYTEDEYDNNYYHDYINTALSYFPSAHRITYPGKSQFLYLAHGGYPLQTTKECNDPPVMPLESKDMYFCDQDILADSYAVAKDRVNYKLVKSSTEREPLEQNSIRWNNYHSIHETTYFPNRGCAIGLKTIEQAREKGYFFTIRAHQDIIANTKILMAPSGNNLNYPDTAGEKIDILMNMHQKIFVK